MLEVHSEICFSRAEVTTISPHGFWLELGEEELYMSFFEFPMFEHATVTQLCQVLWASSESLYWPALDLDLTVATIRNPSGYEPASSIHH